MARQVRPTRGSAAAYNKGWQAAVRIGVDTSGYRSYHRGDLIAELRVPQNGISVRPTCSINTELARHLRHDMPFAIPFELVRWYSPGAAVRSLERRVSYACSSFGVSIPGDGSVESPK